ncbi:MAG: hypothetical protein F4X76_00535 [Chloroflexi bacterium]|nr:hypothetical protein [Chloroflexota bacterium]
MDALGVPRTSGSPSVHRGPYPPPPRRRAAAGPPPAAAPRPRPSRRVDATARCASRCSSSRPSCSS